MYKHDYLFSLSCFIYKKLYLYICNILKTTIIIYFNKTTNIIVTNDGITRNRLRVLCSDFAFRAYPIRDRVELLFLKLHFKLQFKNSSVLYG